MVKPTPSNQKFFTHKTKTKKSRRKSVAPTTDMKLDVKRDATHANEDIANQNESDPHRTEQENDFSNGATINQQLCPNHKPKDVDQSCHEFMKNFQVLKCFYQLNESQIVYYHQQLLN